jgi:hypothetical protein
MGEAIVTQLPAVQLWPAAQVIPQAPQLVQSERASTHAPPQVS